MTLATAPATLRSRRLSVTRDLQALAPAWLRLQEESADASVFATWEWNTATARHLNAGARPHVLLLEDNGPIAILPLAYRRAQTLRTLVFLGSGGFDYSRADYQDWLCVAGEEDASLAAFADELAADAAWEMIWLQELPAASRIAQRLPAVAAARGWRCEVRVLDEAFRLTLPAAWEEYAARLSANTRAAIGRKTRRLVREHAVRFETADTRDLAPALEALFALHTDRWQAAGRPGIFHNDRERRFHRDLSRTLAEAGMLDLMLLEAAGETLGARYGFVFRGVHSFYASGYRLDDEWAPYSLGLVMDGEGIRRAIGAGLDCEDLLRGDGAYKRRYAPERTVNLEMRIFRSDSAYRRHCAYVLARRTARMLRDRLTGRTRRPAPITEATA